VRTFIDPRIIIFGIFGVLCLGGCRHAGPDWSDKEGDPRDKLAFTTRVTVSEREDSYCLSVRLIQTVRSENSSGIDQLSFPDLCVQKNDSSEQVLSLSTKDPDPNREVLPFTRVALEPGEPGLEVRFKVETMEQTNAVARYSILFRLPGTGREHRWTGQDAFPPNVSE
jgi:hypothetical protein